MKLVNYEVDGENLVFNLEVNGLAETDLRGSYSVTGITVTLRIEDGSVLFENLVL